MAASYTFEDYSGTAPSVSDNPYDGLIEMCDNDPAKIQDRYDTHRTTRSKQQKEKLLSPDFKGVLVDQILKRLEDPDEPGFEDHRHCLVFWARPPQKLKDLIAEVQRRLKTVAPNLWLMPQDCLHMTALEITHSLTSQEISALVEQIRPSMEKLTDYTYDHRARLIKPTISYDAQAMALSFLPAAGELGRNIEDDRYSYHHLRRDLYALASETGVKVASRYVVPSAHLTIARFIDAAEFEKQSMTGEVEIDGDKVTRLVNVIEEINEWLEKEFWGGDEDGQLNNDGVWIVGEEKGLEFRQGTLWYGGGERIRLGKGF